VIRMAMKGLAGQRAGVPMHDKNVLPDLLMRVEFAGALCVIDQEGVNAACRNIPILGPA
jgi:hypothetical protein